MSITAGGMRAVTYSGLIAIWIDADGCTWLGPEECAPFYEGEA